MSVQKVSVPLLRSYYDAALRFQSAASAESWLSQRGPEKDERNYPIDDAKRIKNRHANVVSRVRTHILAMFYKMFQGPSSGEAAVEYEELCWEIHVEKAELSPLFNQFIAYAVFQDEFLQQFITLQGLKDAIGVPLSNQEMLSMTYVDEPKPALRVDAFVDHVDLFEFIDRVRLTWDKEAKNKAKGTLPSTLASFQHIKKDTKLPDICLQEKNPEHPKRAPERAARLVTPGARTGRRPAASKVDSNAGAGVTEPPQQGTKAPQRTAPPADVSDDEGPVLPTRRKAAVSAIDSPRSTRTDEAMAAPGRYVNDEYAYSDSDDDAAYPTRHSMGDALYETLGTVVKKVKDSWGSPVVPDVEMARVVDDGATPLSGSAAPSSSEYTLGGVLRRGYDVMADAVSGAATTAAGAATRAAKGAVNGAVAIASSIYSPAAASNMYSPSWRSRAAVPDSELGFMDLAFAAMEDRLANLSRTDPMTGIQTLVKEGLSLEFLVMDMAKETIKFIDEHPYVLTVLGSDKCAILKDAITDMATAAVMAGLGDRLYTSRHARSVGGGHARADGRRQTYLGFTHAAWDKEDKDVFTTSYVTSARLLQFLQSWFQYIIGLMEDAVEGGNGEEIKKCMQLMLKEADLFVPSCMSAYRLDNAVERQPNTDCPEPHERQSQVRDGTGRLQLNMLDAVLVLMPDGEVPEATVRMMFMLACGTGFEPAETLIDVDNERDADEVVRQLAKIPSSEGEAKQRLVWVPHMMMAAYDARCNDRSAEATTQLSLEVGDIDPRVLMLAKQSKLLLRDKVGLGSPATRAVTLEMLRRLSEVEQQLQTRSTKADDVVEYVSVVDQACQLNDVMTDAPALQTFTDLVLGRSNRLGTDVERNLKGYYEALAKVQRELCGNNPSSSKKGRAEVGAIPKFLLSKIVDNVLRSGQSVEALLKANALAVLEKQDLFHAEMARSSADFRRALGFNELTQEEAEDDDLRTAAILKKKNKDYAFDREPTMQTVLRDVVKQESDAMKAHGLGR